MNSITSPRVLSCLLSLCLLLTVCRPCDARALVRAELPDIDDYPDDETDPFNSESMQIVADYSDMLNEIINSNKWQDTNTTDSYRKTYSKKFLFNRKFHDEHRPSGRFGSKPPTPELEQYLNNLVHYRNQLISDTNKWAFAELKRKLNRELKLNSAAFVFDKVSKTFVLCATVKAKRNNMTLGVGDNLKNPNRAHTARVCSPYEALGRKIKRRGRRFEDFIPRRTIKLMRKKLHAAMEPYGVAVRKGNSHSAKPNVLTYSQRAFLSRFKKHYRNTIRETVEEYLYFDFTALIYGFDEYCKLHDCLCAFDFRVPCQTIFFLTP